jgi:hypothetical protein
MEGPNQPGYEKNRQHSAKSDSCAAAVSPAAAPVVPSTDTKNQQQDNQ